MVFKYHEIERSGGAITGRLEVRYAEKGVKLLVQEYHERPNYNRKQLRYGPVLS